MLMEFGFGMKKSRSLAGVIGMMYLAGCSLAWIAS
jgi:hypothetical protein